MNFLTTLSDRARILAKEAAVIITETKSITVTNDEQKSNTLELLKKIKGVANGLEAERTAQKKPILEAGREIDGAYKAEIDKLAKAESVLKQSVLSYDQEQRRKAQELQRKLQAAAEEKARKEREKLAAQAEKAAAAGKIEKAEALQEKAEEVQVFVPIVQAVETKVTGVSTRKAWKYRIIDVNKLPREYMIPNEAMLAALARSTQGNIPVPGVEFYAEDILAVNSRGA